MGPPGPGTQGVLSHLPTAGKPGEVLNDTMEFLWREGLV